MCLLEKVQKEKDCTDPVLQLLEFAGLTHAVCKEAQSPPAAGGVGWGGVRGDNIKSLLILLLFFP